ncbi:MAG: 5-(carboxyamino)imidazole ribonucleotide synthase [Gammaproteobacteria bacterium]|nr:5-(carboxyamino)imidazole ribonucleotide synthase [Gammaproteobacteria bacterium]MDH3970913.1 5-(carboxyamino)imidazole ribonucleotide synthase [Gammaproteobacteria bacterium]MDH3985140.1 5-(carboxyamino)imidazole ribonucleotide synthase [Gammaproteobacteria bacterium]
MILPDSSLGVLGGGQLGRMFTLAAHSMGYRVVVLDPDPHSPAGQIAEQHIKADYRDRAALQMLGDECAAITTEFENIPAESVEFLEQFAPVRPATDAVRIAQNRIEEKTFIQQQGLATAPFAAIYEAADIAENIAALQPPLLLKTASMGYDGKGQQQVGNADEARAAFLQMGGTPCVLEEMLELEREISVVLVRNIDGLTAVYPVGENRHVNGILETTIVPCAATASITDTAIEMARKLADAMNYCGVLAVEFFCTRQGELLINEMAPRPHNSGHYTVDACATSQFEQQVRMMCGLAPSDTRLLSAVVMTNLMGDIWNDGDPAWQHVLNQPGAHLHLYGKREARPGRKMGHINCLADDTDKALQVTAKIRAALNIKP